MHAALSLCWDAIVSSLHTTRTTVITSYNNSRWYCQRYYGTVLEKGIIFQEPFLNPLDKITN